MPHPTLRRSARAGLAMTFALAGSVLLSPAPVSAGQGAQAIFEAPPPSAPAADLARPFSGKGWGIGYAEVAPDGRISFVAAGVQRFTDLGRSTYHLEGVCTDPTCTSSVSTTTNVAEDGDTLTFLETVSDGESSLIITGGTGRFAGASGSATTTGTFTADPSSPLVFTTTFESVGEIILRPGRRS